MSDLYILIADNDPDALEIYREFLTLAGYKVHTARSVSEARHILNTCHVHLAIFDLRLTDDAEESDRSGLLLAKEATRSMPKLILTKWPTYQDVREAMKWEDTTLPPAVDFINKKDGLEALGEAVKQAIARYVRINRRLNIQPGESSPITFPHLLTQIMPALDADRIQDGAEELEDLFRKLFYEDDHIKFGRLLWHREGRVALTVFTFAEERSPEALVVVCGQKEKILEQARRYQEFAPKAAGHNGTVLSRSGDTPHFAASAYALADAEIENALTLSELYRTASERTFNAALDNLFEQTLAEWHQETRLPENSRTPDELYREQLGLNRESFTPVSFKNQVQALIRQLPALGMSIQESDEKLTIQFGGEIFSYPDVAQTLADIYRDGRPALLIKTPGILSGDNILTGTNGRTWLTDFSAAGLGPHLWNFVTIEAAIRFDWMEISKLQWVYELEQSLTGSEFYQLPTTDVELPLRKQTRAIRHIRRLASRAINRDYSLYHLGIFFHAVRRLMDFNRSLPLTTNELARLGHALIAVLVIGVKIKQSPPRRSPHSAPRAPGIDIDKESRTVLIGGAHVPLRGQSYELLYHLYIHANKLCSRRALVEQVFGEKYDESDVSQTARLNTAIRRLREKIEDDPDHPRLLLTELQGGYRLVTKTILE